MLVTLFLSDKVLYYRLPTEVSGSFSFYPENEEEKLINIEGIDGKWKFYSTSDSEIISNGLSIETAELVSNSFYVLKRNNVSYLVYVSDFSLGNMFIFNSANAKDIELSSSESANICYRCPCIINTVYKFTKNDNYVTLHKTGNAQIYINNFGYSQNDIMIKFGDIINIYGLTMIFLKDKLLISMIPNKVSVNEPACNITKLNSVYDNNLNEYEIKDIDLYTENDYYSKSPRLRRQITTKEVKLSNPPSTQEQKTSMFMIIGPMFTMGLVSIVTLSITIQNIVNKKATLSGSITQILMSISMILSTILWPTITQWYTRKSSKKAKQRNILKYRKYLERKDKELQDESTNQKVILKENLLSTDECINLIEHKSMGFWSKRSDQNDFLVARLGTGSVPLDIKFSYNEEEFSLESNELKDEAEKLREKYKLIENVPIGYSFYKNKITAIMGNKNKSYDFINCIVLQMLSFYNYEDLKFVIVTNKDNEYRWDYFKYLNHTFNNDRSFRYFASDIESVKSLNDTLQYEFNQRLNNSESSKKPQYFIIVDGYDNIRRYDIIKNISECEENLGFNVVILDSKISKLPSRCNNIIVLNDDKCEVLEDIYENQKQTSFIDETKANIDMMHYTKLLSNIPIELDEGNKNIPDIVTFLEMEKVGKVEQLNILNRWQTNDSTQSLKAEVGIDEQGDVMYLDLHEKYHGPHGLIAGTTGSGKSEFIITYILSMCINYSPDDVAFILIDYKGGGLAGAFENKTSNLVLPHLVGTITNLDKAELDRTLVSISSEISHRQMVFNDARDKLGESTMDIYKYQKFYKDGMLKEPVPHLFIICDEFAELKVQEPEFIDNLISVARIGRSLGIHLILATQKPSGVVNDQIWSNSRFRICLKVQDESDSREMLKRDEASKIVETGRFYLQVGNDELFELAQSAWCGAKYFPSEKVKKKVDKNIDFINDIGQHIKSLQFTSSIGTEAKGDQVTAILKSIVDASVQTNKRSKKLWLENISSEIFISDLVTKYQISYEPYNVNAIIGEYDAPEKQTQGLVKYNLLEDGNTVIIGNDGKEREELLKTIIFDTTYNHSPKEIVYYIIDYGSEQLLQFSKLPHIGGIVTSSDEDKYHSLVKLIRNEIRQRKKQFANYGGSYKIYNEKSENKLPLNVIIVNNFDSFYENNQDVYDTFPELVRDAERYGIVFIFTCDGVGSIPSRVSQACSNTYVLKLKDASDYYSAFGFRVDIVPRDIFGRGLANVDGVHEFQTASISKNDKTSIIDIVDSYASKYQGEGVKKIPELPSKVAFDMVKPYLEKLDNIPIGISKSSIEVKTYNITELKNTLMLSNKVNDFNNYYNSLIQVLRNIKKTNLIILDAKKTLKDLNEKYGNYYSSNFEVVIAQMNNYFEKYTKQNINANIVLIINGISDILDQLTDKTLIDSLFRIIKTINTVYTIVFDSSNKLKQYVYDSWFTESFDLNNGIWLGSGVADQGLLRLSNLNNDMYDKIDNNMGYVIIDSYAELVKTIDFTDSGDNNEE